MAPLMPEPRLLQHGIYSCSLPESAQLLAAAVAGFQRVAQSPDTIRTHYFNGRYENIYPRRESLPEVEPLLKVILGCARRVLATAQPLQLSFWFNLMLPGHSTTLHTHDDGYELISGVYYLEVAENSGDILMHTADEVLAITPQAGQLLLFPPDLPHAVEENRSARSRLSLAFNIGPQAE
jgi:hypothetical protein